MRGEVAVQYRRDMAVQRLQGVQRGVQQALTVLRRQPTFGLQCFALRLQPAQVLAQGPALQPFHDQVDGVVFFDDVMHLHDPGVAELGQ